MSLKESIIDESKALTPSSDTGATGEGERQGRSLRYSTEKEALGGGGPVSQDVPGKQSGKYFSRHGRV